MSSQKKDLEIIFNLQWKYGIKAAERSIIVGVYDIPSTTLSWEPFKSYILKNSGTTGDDVKVSYFEDGKEIPITSTIEFQTALYTFRKKAMNGEIINLKLQRVVTGTKPRISPTCDAQTECNYDSKMERAPEWFAKYMEEFKKEIIREVASTISTHTATIKPSVSHSHYPRKSKTECVKRCRKSHHHDGNEKEVLKTLKMEKKLENKMEKLVSKSKKLKEKKMSLITKSSDSDAGHSSSKSNSEAVSNVHISKMDAAPVRTEQAQTPHLMGGEVYRHCWKVINNGSAPWTEDTVVRCSWGSSLLQPIERVIPCPLLNPMEIGEIEAMIHVPKICGKYQMYWHFYHKGRKFGHWLGCEIIVDKLNPSEPFSTSFLRSIASKYDIAEYVPKYPSYEAKTPNCSVDVTNSSNDQMINEERKLENTRIEQKMKELDITRSGPMPVWLDDFIPSELKMFTEKEYIKTDKREIPYRQNFTGLDHCSLVIDQSDVEKDDYMEDYIKKMVEKETELENEQLAILQDHSKIESQENFANVSVCSNTGRINFDDLNDSMDGNHNIDAEGGDDSQSESISKIDEETSSNSTLNDMVIVDIPEEDQDVTGYAYVVIDGVKMPVPKKYLRPDFLETAEDAPEQNQDDEQGASCMHVNNEFEVVEDNDGFEDIPDLVPSNRDGSVQSSTQDVLVVSTPEPVQLPHNYLDFTPQNTPCPGNNIDLSNVAGPSRVNLLDNTPASRLRISEPTRRFVFPERHGGYEIIKDNDIEVSASSTSDNDLAVYQPPLPIVMKKPVRFDLIDSSEHLTNNPNGLYPKLQEVPVLSPERRDDAQECSSTTEAAPMNSNEKDDRNRSSSSDLPSSSGKTDRRRSVPEASAPISSVVSGAMTALKTVVNRIIPSKNEQEPGVWLNGHWVPYGENTIREKNLKMLADMGFMNRDLNATLLARYNDDIRRVVTELVQ